WLIEHAEHSGVRDLMRDLNRAYRESPALWQVDFTREGFRWLEPNDAANNALAFMRIAADGSQPVVCAANLSPVPREGYRIGVPHGGAWKELVNTDSGYYGGSGIGNLGEVVAEKRGWHDQPYSVDVVLPPLGVIWLRPAGES
ncbi:MAG TPA: alpha amylase C-terminal domain-containing protein, partial [Gaiellaceae bacterium]|nr:alpha amylase C-terminal domain-containing protein [Gaiellaceae bacterium]